MLITNTNRDQSKPQPPRVVVAMSGGVDSSVAAALLVEQGYEVIGMMMRLWSESADGQTKAFNRCCTPDQMADARRIAERLNIPFYVLDVQDYFRQSIVQFFIDEHVAGRTPNPCIECNRQIRFTYLLEQALALDADYLATGHYARVQQSPDGYHLLKAVDANKDQSYVLHVLGQEQLAKVLFPIGAYTKDEVRQLARDFNLPVASKQESQDLCFLKDGDYRRFLREYSASSPAEGPIFTTSGLELGRHEGLPYYTIGQRKGLGISAVEPLFVLRKDASRNALIVGTREELGRQTLIARDVNWVSGSSPAEPIEVEVKIRYKASPALAVLSPISDNSVQVVFMEPVFGITAGQGAVFYQGDECIGGGIITHQDEIEGGFEEANGFVHSSAIEVVKP
ncbi:MAG: tRNA 2-thiouridine(34) synthase MnmA [Chloroflexota bacterium]|jgi:tRNA-uridine 2-sulfurtransferase